MLKCLRAMPTVSASNFELYQKLNKLTEEQMNGEICNSSKQQNVNYRISMVDIWVIAVQLFQLLCMFGNLYN